MTRFVLTPELRDQFHQDGYLIVDGLLDPQETELLGHIARADHELEQQASQRADGEGGSVKLVVRNDLAVDTIYGAIVRSRRIVSVMSELLQDEVYHYHHKLILKEAKV